MKTTHCNAPATLLALLAAIWTSGHAGRIIYPWGSISAIIKTGDKLEIMFQAEGGETVKSVEFRGPYNRIPAQPLVLTTGSWVYDKMSGNSYNTRIAATVPLQTPEELYDLVVTTTSGLSTSRSAVKVIKEYRRDFTFVQFSDTHMGRTKQDDYPAELDKISSLIEVINIVSPDMVFVTGDLVDATPKVVNLFPDDAQRWRFFYEGYPAKGLRGIKDIRSPTFAVPGNHDWEESLAAAASCRKRADFWNRYNGIQGHHFRYGDARFVMTNNGWNDCSGMDVINSHNEWLKAVGPGKLRVLPKHIYGHTSEELEFARLNDIQMGLAGHNHNIGPESPYRQGVTDMYISNWIHHMTFSVFNVDSSMKVQYLHNKVAVENPYEDPSRYRPQLTLAYANANNGGSTGNTAVITNKLDIGFPRIRLRFVMRKGSYQVVNGIVEQIIENDTATVVDVRATVGAKGTLTVKIGPANTGITGNQFLKQIKIRAESTAGMLEVRFPLRKSSRVKAWLHTLEGSAIRTPAERTLGAGEHGIRFDLSGTGAPPTGFGFVKLEIHEHGSNTATTRVVRVLLR